MFNDPNTWYQGCPPDSAEKPSGLTVFRIGESDPLTISDLQSHFEVNIRQTGTRARIAFSEDLARFIGDGGAFSRGRVARRCRAAYHS